MGGPMANGKGICAARFEEMIEEAAVGAYGESLQTVSRCRLRPGGLALRSRSARGESPILD